MRSLSLQFGRFAVAGVAGLVVDVAVLYLALALGLGAYAGRAVSFLSAVWTTWRINRRFAFGHVEHGSAWRQWLIYLGANLGGGALNYATYSLVMSIAAPRPWLPLAAVAAGSVAGMFLNFASARLVVFRP